MDKKTVSKIRLFLDGLILRMEENKPFFSDITVTYKSGTKDFTALITYEGDDTVLDYQAVRKKVDSTELCDIICNEALKYDDVNIAYNERGAVIFAAQLTERVPAGTCHCYESCAEYKPLGKPGESIDRGGCINILTASRYLSKYATGMATEHCLVEIEKWDKKELKGWKKKPLDLNNGGAETLPNWNDPAKPHPGADRKARFFIDPKRNKEMVWNERAWKYSGEEAWKKGVK